MTFEEEFARGFDDEAKGKAVLNSILKKDPDFVKKGLKQVDRKVKSFALDPDDTLKRTAQNQGKFLDHETAIQERGGIVFSKRANDLLFNDLETRLTNNTLMLEGKVLTIERENELNKERAQKLTPMQESVNIFAQLQAQEKAIQRAEAKKKGVEKWRETTKESETQKLISEPADNVQPNVTPQSAEPDNDIDL